MNKVSLLFGIHMHQPVDNFGSAVDNAIALCYKPFFETMIKYPQFKFSLHCSGWLLDKIRVEHPGIFKNIKALTKSDSIEWIGAGYYEPVLSSIPSKDRRAQIQKLSDYIYKHFKVRPKGLWLTERVWESSLVPDLVASDIEFTVLDDYHFLSSGFDASKMDGYYTTEESAQDLALFPISQSLRYALPFFSVEKAIDAIIGCSQNENSAAIIFDDAEKFGLWPKTHEWVYEKKWLENFVQSVLENPRIVPQHYTNYYKENRSLGIAYLNNTSYFEMGEWSLKAPQTLALEALKNQVGDDYFNTLGVSFIKGGVWKNFFIKYHESNYIHKRMLYCSLLQETLQKNAVENLYKLQTNDVFWHGVFGGLYLPNLRDNAYSYLLAIEKSRGIKKTTIETIDIDKDGYDELKVITKNLSIVFSTKFAGQMIEFGSFDTLFNWQNTLMRREEAYHDKILHPKCQIDEDVTSEDEIATIHGESALISDTLKAELIYDWHAKNSFIEHFSNEAFTLDTFKNLTYKEVGDFVNQPFELSQQIFSRKGGLYLDKKYPTTVTKSYLFDSNRVDLTMHCQTEYPKTLYFAEEFNFHFAHPHHVLFNGNKIEEGLTLLECDELLIVDSFTQKVLKITLNQKCTVFGCILHTISQSESGFDKVAQGISFIFTGTFNTHLALDINVEVLNV